MHRPPPGAPLDWEEEEGKRSHEPLEGGNRMVRKHVVSRGMGTGGCPVLVSVSLALVIAAGAIAPVCAETIVLGQNPWDIAWGNSDPFAAGYSRVQGDNPWKPEAIDEYGAYNMIRMMDWNCTNDHYSARKHNRWSVFITDPRWTGRKKKDALEQLPMAYEWQIDFCNKANAHMWLNVPHKADDEYCLKLATLVKTGVDMGSVDMSSMLDKVHSMSAEQLVAAGGTKTCDGLLPHLKVYLEWSNETWLFHYDYTVQQGEKLGLERASPYYHAYASVRVFKQFDYVFPRSRGRLIRIVAGQAGNAWVGDKRLEPIYGKDPTVNPGIIDGVDAYAIATYWSGSPDRKDRWVPHKQVADKYGIKLFFYEGGESENGATTEAAMESRYQAWFAIMENIGFSAGCHYMHSGGAQWATIPRTGMGRQAAMAYPKYKAIAGYCATIPKQTVRVRAERMYRPLLPRHAVRYDGAIAAADLLGRMRPMAAGSETTPALRAHGSAGLYIVRPASRPAAAAACIAVR